MKMFWCITERRTSRHSLGQVVYSGGQVKARSELENEGSIVNPSPMLTVLVALDSDITMMMMAKRKEFLQTGTRAGVY